MVDSEPLDLICMIKIRSEREREGGACRRQIRNNKRLKEADGGFLRSSVAYSEQERG